MTEKLAELFEEDARRSRRRACAAAAPAAFVNVLVASSRALPALHADDAPALRRGGSSAPLLRPLLAGAARRWRRRRGSAGHASRSARRPIEAFDPRDPSRRSSARSSSAAGSSSPRRTGISAASRRIRMLTPTARFLALTDKGRWLRGRIVYAATRPVGIADAEMAPILGPDGRPISAPRLVRHRSARRGRRHALCRHRARPPDPALRLRPRRPARARPADRACRPRCKSLPSNKGLEALVFVPPKASRSAAR